MQHRLKLRMYGRLPAGPAPLTRPRSPGAGEVVFSTLVHLRSQYTLSEINSTLHTNSNREPCLRNWPRGQHITIKNFPRLDDRGECLSERMGGCASSSPVDVGRPSNLSHLSPITDRPTNGRTGQTDRHVQKEASSEQFVELVGSEAGTAG